jgi:hypothetical protein
LAYLQKYYFSRKSKAFKMTYICIMLNANIPHFKALVKRSYFTQIITKS